MHQLLTKIPSVVAAWAKAPASDSSRFEHDGATWQRIDRSGGHPPSLPSLTELLGRLREGGDEGGQLWCSWSKQGTTGVIRRGGLSPVQMPVRGTRPAVEGGTRCELVDQCVVVRGAEPHPVAQQVLRLLQAPGLLATSTSIQAHAHRGYLAVEVDLGPVGAQQATEHHGRVVKSSQLPPRSQATQVLARRVAAGESITLALCDLDKTQAINDLYGRALTEEVVRRIFNPARRTAERLGAHAFMYLSGDEFGVIGRSTADARGLREVLTAIATAFTEVEHGLAVVVADDTTAEQLDAIVAACPRIVAATLHGRLGSANLLVDISGLDHPEQAHRIVAEPSSRALGRRVSLRPHWFNEGRFWVPSFTSGAIAVSARELGSQGLRDAEPDAMVATLLSRAGLMCRLAKRHRGSIVVATDHADFLRRVAVFPEPKPVSRPGVTIPATFAADGVADPTTGLHRQSTLETEALPHCFAAGGGAYLEISDISYSSPDFVEEQHKAIKWGPVYDGQVLGARIMAINEYYGYEAGNNSVKLVGANVRKALPPRWQQRATLARKSPDKIQLVLSERPSVEDVLAFVDAFQQCHGQCLSPELTVRMRALLVPFDNARSVQQILDDIEPLRLMDREVATYRSARERSSPGTGNFVVVYEIARDDAAGRGRFEREYRAMQETISRRMADEIVGACPLRDARRCG